MMRLMLMRRSHVVAATLLVLLAGCQNAPEAKVAAAPRGVLATWDVDPMKPPTKDAREVAVLVSRTECAGFQPTGPVRRPVIEESTHRITVTYTLQPLTPTKGGSDYTCPGNPPTPTTFRLKNKVGGRQLFDGSCAYSAPGSPASACKPRMRWPVG